MHEVKQRRHNRHHSGGAMQPATHSRVGFPPELRRIRGESLWLSRYTLRLPTVRKLQRKARVGKLHEVRRSVRASCSILFLYYFLNVRMYATMSFT
jgi:hypothetical protein